MTTGPRRFRLDGDAVAGLVLFAGSVFLFVVAGGLPRSALVPIGPGFYPRLLFGVLAFLGALLVVASLVKARPAPAEAQIRPNYRLVAASFALFGLYVLVLPYLGFRIATFFFVALLQATIDPPRTLGRWVTVLAVAFLTSLLTYLAFEQYLYVLLPRGTWTDF
jgi:putative tricarboxylic transport membrane protein